MRRYLAIDGGNSKTDVVIGAEDGSLLGSAHGLGTCYQNIGLDETMRRLRTLVASASVSSEPLDRAEIFLAGADLPPEVAMLTEAITAEGWATEVTIHNDTPALLRAGTDTPDAIAVVCGAGINCFGRTGDGRTAGFPSLGTVSGDWGGGGHLSNLALWHAVRGEDGRGPATALSPAVADHFGLSTAEAVAAAIHLGSIDRSRLNELSAVLFAVSADGDDVAREVVDRQAEEIVSLATVVARRLDLLDAPFVLVLGGGVLRARHPQLIDAVEAGVRSAAPFVRTTIVAAPPVLGAALSALDAFDAPAAAHTALRAAFAARAPQQPAAVDVVSRAGAAS